MPGGQEASKNNPTCLDILHDVISAPTVFRDESKLSFDYVPKALLHRNRELRQLGNYFRHMIDKPQSVAHRVIISGSVGSGKTALTRRFGQDFETLARLKFKNPYSFFFLHVNCRRQSSAYQIVLTILKRFHTSFPHRGFSLSEIIDSLLSSLRGLGQSLLLALDEVDFLLSLPKGTDLLYDLLRYGEESKHDQKPLSLILVTRNPSFMNSLDSSIQSSLQKNHLTLCPYQLSHLRDIIQARADLALNRDVLISDALDLMSEIAFQQCDARYGMELLWRAGKKADTEGNTKIFPEHVRAAVGTLTPSLDFEILEYLTESQRALLLAISQELKAQGTAYVSFNSVAKTFAHICEERHLKEGQFSLQVDLEHLRQQGIIFLKGSQGKAEQEMTLWDVAYTEICNL
ncbi:MAG: Cdc6/Cdc18 family protein [Candidatus Hodarchaeota archaeon]